MAYSDYGGRAYRNHEQTDDRCDAVLTPDGIRATPGSWPGWTLPEGRDAPCFHVLLGDGPILVGLHKQSTVRAFRLGEEIDLVPLLADPMPGDIAEYDGTRYVDDDAFRDERVARFEIDGHRLDVYWTHTDNYYLFVRLTQPDGTVWHGWSGYGVGAGLEEAGYGYSSDDVDEVMWLTPWDAATGEEDK